MTTALKRGVLADDHYHALVEVMTSLNDNLANLTPRYQINACTDVTGFGLLGHLLEMLRASKVSTEIIADQVPLISGCKRIPPGRNGTRWHPAKPGLYGAISSQAGRNPRKLNNHHGRCTNQRRLADIIALRKPQETCWRR